MVEKSESEYSDLEEGSEGKLLQNDEKMKESESSQAEPTKPLKKKKRGIIYVSTIPKFMNVTILREMLDQYAKVGRIFLQPEKVSDEAKKKRKKKRVSRHFTEGWVEFESKKAAKLVAEKLNNTPIATRKSSKFYDILWSIKYLPRFKWVHLSERLTYENAVKRQKMRTEISQARKEATFFQDNLDKSERIKKIKKQVKKSNKNKNKDISA